MKICAEAQIFLKQSRLRLEQHRIGRAHNNPNESLLLGYSRVPQKFHMVIAELVGYAVFTGAHTFMLSG